jgi:hypothetical protein
LKNLADDVGGGRAADVVEKSVLREVKVDDAAPETAKDASEKQVELLRALLRTMDPAVVDRALSGK